MPRNYDAIDLQWGYTGDSLLGLDGDFADTQRDQILSLVQQIQTVVASEFQDWEEHPQRAAGLDEFVGEANRRETANEVQARIRSALVVNDVINDED